MTHVSKSALLEYTAAQVFSVVADVARYPEFLPWCKATQIHASSPEGMHATITMALAGFEYGFTTQNTHTEPTEILLALADANRVSQAFSSLRGTWRFKPLGTLGCKVELNLEYAFASPLIGRLIGPLFDPAAATLMDRFIRRTQALHG
jgi:ribosome-associated toxin RatA of RatAB toxin-antitoxin module